ncbi:hypothetical protein [Winogradskya humida]|uniref:Uncharacterized protein n=1 Tax=Winogradskya humida TaxID=113566 RepID=A0ABQ3ZXD4_9ACTN|nr:hypothetical protein [Actinoplanes humidus]GIE23239.1 hypothetical protein Ahu01nite_063410 [Actinoplanes humidus]
MTSSHALRKSIFSRLRAFLESKSWGGISAITGLVALGLAAVTTLVTLSVKNSESVPYRGEKCREGTASQDVRTDAAALETSTTAPLKVLDVGVKDKDRIYGSPRSGPVDGETFYWGRVASDRANGGVQLLWRINDGPWHDCRSDLSADNPDYVYTPAVASEIGEKQVTFKVCIWRNNPHLQSCWNDTDD